ncbi:MAG: response regulator transcription factor [Chloroflexi bacterium]|nr:response regulator transcription factor [Chloroflexota bacterium]
MNKPIPHVVSVEDDDGIYELLQVTLEALPIVLHRASDGRAAIELITHVQPDLLLLDIALPDMHGWDVLKTVCEQHMKPRKIIVLTAYSEPAHRLIAHFQEVDRYVQKPFSPMGLRQVVCTLLELTESPI